MAAKAYPVPSTQYLERAGEPVAGTTGRSACPTGEGADRSFAREAGLRTGRSGCRTEANPAEWRRIHARER